jgi:hypothetical protein
MVLDTEIEGLLPQELCQGSVCQMHSHLFQLPI